MDLEPKLNDFGSAIQKKEKGNLLRCSEKKIFVGKFVENQCTSAARIIEYNFSIVMLFMMRKEPYNAQLIKKPHTAENPGRIFWCVIM